MGGNWSWCQNLITLDKLDTKEAECRRTVPSGRRVAGAFRSLVNNGAWSFSVLRSCMMHCSCLFLCTVARQ